MIKKEYMKPAMKVVLLHHRIMLLAGSLSGVSTTGLDNDLVYDEIGGNLGIAW